MILITTKKISVNFQKVIFMIVHIIFRILIILKVLDNYNCLKTMTGGYRLLWVWAG